MPQHDQALPRVGHCMNRLEHASWIVSSSIMLCCAALHQGAGLRGWANPAGDHVNRTVSVGRPWQLHSSSSTGVDSTPCRLKGLLEGTQEARQSATQPDSSWLRYTPAAGGEGHMHAKLHNCWQPILTSCILLMITQLLSLRVTHSNSRPFVGDHGDPCRMPASVSLPQASVTSS